MTFLTGAPTPLKHLHETAGDSMISASHASKQDRPSSIQRCQSLQFLRLGFGTDLNGNGKSVSFDSKLHHVDDTSYANRVLALGMQTGTRVGCVPCVT